MYKCIDSNLLKHLLTTVLRTQTLILTGDTSNLNVQIILFKPLDSHDKDFIFYCFICELKG